MSHFLKMANSRTLLSASPTWDLLQLTRSTPLLQVSARTSRRSTRLILWLCLETGPKKYFIQTSLQLQYWIQPWMPLRTRLPNHLYRTQFRLLRQTTWPKQLRTLRCLSQVQPIRLKTCRLSQSLQTKPKTQPTCRVLLHQRKPIPLQYLPHYQRSLQQKLKMLLSLTNHQHKLNLKCYKLATRLSNSSYQ